MLTRLDASWEDPIRVVAVPAAGLSQGLLLENGVLTVSLEPEDAIAITLDDGTHAAATGRQVPVTWSYVVAVTIRGAVVPDAIAALQSAALDLGAEAGADPLPLQAQPDPVDGVEVAGRGRRGRRRADAEPATEGAAPHPVFVGGLRQDNVAISPETAHADPDVTITAATLRRRLSQDLLTSRPESHSAAAAPEAAVAEAAAPEAVAPEAPPAPEAAVAEPARVEHSVQDDDATITAAELARVLSRAVASQEPEPEPEPVASPEQDPEQDPDVTVTATELARLLAMAVPTPPPGNATTSAPPAAEPAIAPTPAAPETLVDIPEASTHPRSGFPAVPGSRAEPSDRDVEVMDSTIVGFIDPHSLSLPTRNRSRRVETPAANAVPAANYVPPSAGASPARPAAPSTGGRPSASMLAAAAALAAEQVPAPAPAAPQVPFDGPSLRISDSAGAREVGIDATLVLGRNPSVAQVRERDARAVSVFPTGGGVSHTHVSVRVQAGTILVRDLWSTNGTRVKGFGVPPFRLRDGEEVPVSPGTVVELGDGVRLEIAAGGGILGA